MLNVYKQKRIDKNKRVDHLGITPLRIREIWHIQNPNKVFDCMLEKMKKFTVNALMLEEKYLLFPSMYRLVIEKEKVKKDLRKRTNKNDKRK